MREGGDEATVILAKIAESGYSRISAAEHLLNFTSVMQYALYYRPDPTDCTGSFVLIFAGHFGETSCETDNQPGQRLAMDSSILYTPVK